MAGCVPDFLALLRVLAAHDVELIVVGGVCAVLHGAPVTTFDLDVVHNRDNANLTRLLDALAELEAGYRGRGTQRLIPSRPALAGPGHHLLMTTGGPLDLLGTIGAGRGFPELVGHTAEVEVESMPLRILDLSTLVQVKEETARAKDLLMLNILKRLLEEGGGVG